MHFYWSFWTYLMFANHLPLQTTVLRTDKHVLSSHWRGSSFNLKTSGYRVMLRMRGIGTWIQTCMMHSIIIRTCTTYPCSSQFHKPRPIVFLGVYARRKAVDVLAVQIWGTKYLGKPVRNANIHFSFTVR